VYQFRPLKNWKEVKQSEVQAKSIACEYLKCGGLQNGAVKAFISES
jgi:hypothetical protein